MRSKTIFGALAVVFTGIMPAYAQHKAIPTTQLPQVTNPQTAVSTNLCFTCGGDWPIFAGEIPTPSAADERGSGCSGGFSTTSNDHFPFLCTR
jgi:hypothetical protein